MRSFPKRTRAAAVGLAALGAATMGGRGAARLVRRARKRLEREVRHARGRWSGFAYRVGGATPDLMPGDDVLVDRVRSSIGNVTAHLDVPRPNVMVVDGVAILHGAVGTDKEKRALEAAVAAVPGITAVRSEIHVGLGPGDTRPSHGAQPEVSAALIALRRGASLAGAEADRVLGAALTAFLSRLPMSERGHVAAHLPADVRALMDAAALRGDLIDLRDPEDLVTQVALTAPGVARRRLERIVPRVIGVLRTLVPEEAADVRAVLPEGLRPLWAPVQVG